MNPHFGFWLSVALVVVNIGIVIFAPLQQLRLHALTTAGLCGAAALMFWASANKAER